jgi:hypothetical protein
MAVGDQRFCPTLGANSFAGTVVVDGAKVVKVDFPKTYSKIPHVSFTLGDSMSPTVPCRQIITKTHFKLRFKSTYTGEVDWFVEPDQFEYLTQE